ncbi:hypothetical protein BpHYR1_038356 [Brachionus plicatilis]|uniref:Uncharacterized protein n=1 Tax=Brachionus plicatilis TaxID=10195 RepID=A0A3M7RDQ3_BRAPC|nr:hypothetical protein BpHYR1_038356 [Brachionus plicatilis]
MFTWCSRAFFCGHLNSRHLICGQIRKENKFRDQKKILVTNFKIISTFGLAWLDKNSMTKKILLTNNIF